MSYVVRLRCPDGRELQSGQPSRYCTAPFRLATRTTTDVESAAIARSRAAMKAAIFAGGIGSAGGIERCAVMGLMNEPSFFRR